MKTIPSLSRRQFLRRSAAAGAILATVPTIIPASAFGRGKVRPGERIAVGCIGVGERGRAVMGHFLNQADCQVVAVCDVKSDARAQALADVNGRYHNRDCQSYADFRELVARRDIDAVLIASTDHWHVLHALAAVRAGQDVYVEKPLGLSLAADQLLRREVQRRGRIFQFGTQQRSDRKFRLACELVRNGGIGKLKHINIWAPGSKPGGSTRIVPPSAGLDYDSWLGPALQRPHTENLTSNAVWWFVSDFAIGFLAGWGIHPLDIALWGAGDLARGTVEVEGVGNFPSAGACDTATTWDVDFKFANGLTMKFVGCPNGAPDEKFIQQAEWQQRYRSIQEHGTAFEGADGWVRVDRGSLEVQPESLLELNEAEFKTKLVRSADHVRNFLDSVRTRKPTVCPVEEAVRSDVFCQLADIAARLRRKLTYDGEREQFIGDESANRHLALRTPRTPWRY